MADIAHPIYERNRNHKTRRLYGGDKEQIALDTIKSEIYKQNVLVPFNTDREYETILTCDASELGMGAMVEQQQTNGTVRPVMHWSSTFRSYEKNYSISEKEALACVAEINKFRIYLLGRHFMLRTDHQALPTLLLQTETKQVTARPERWREKISMYDYHVKVIPGAREQDR